MANSTRQKLDELKELKQQGYLSEEEFAAARGNILLDAGFDIVPRTDSDNRLAYAPPPREDGEKKGGCGCLFALLLLLVLLLGGIFAMPEDVARGVPGLERIFGNEQVQAARRTLLQFIDDLMGKSERPDLSASSDVKHDVKHVESALAAPEPAAENMRDERRGTRPDSANPTVEVSSDTEGRGSANEGGEESASSDSDDASPRTAVDAESEGEAPETRTEPAASSVWGNSVRIRSTPDRSSDDNIVGRARKGEPLTILEEITNEKGEKWCRVRMDHGDREGWIKAELVQPVRENSRQ